MVQQEASRLRAPGRVPMKLPTPHPSRLLRFVNNSQATVTTDYHPPDAGILVRTRRTHLPTSVGSVAAPLNRKPGLDTLKQE